LGLLVGEVDELEAAEPGFGTGEGAAFGQNADVVNAATGDLRNVKSVRFGPQDVDCQAFGFFSRPRRKLKGQPAFTDVDQLAGDLSAMAEDVELRIPDAVAGMLPLICFHLIPSEVRVFAEPVSKIGIWQLACHMGK